MEHQHQWQTFFTEFSKAVHIDADKYLTFNLIQTCECGIYRIKEFKHEEDYKAKDGGDNN
jgi:hypothetical protein